MAQAQHQEPSGGALIGRALKIAGETGVAPGSSLILDGKIGLGALHLFSAGIARSLLGPAGFLYVAANSYTKSVTGNHIHEHILGGGGDKKK